MGRNEAPAVSRSYGVFWAWNSTALSRERRRQARVAVDHKYTCRFKHSSDYILSMAVFGQRQCKSH